MAPFSDNPKARSEHSSTKVVFQTACGKHLIEAKHEIRIENGWKAIGPGGRLRGEWSEEAHGQPVSRVVFLRVATTGLSDEEGEIGDAFFVCVAPKDLRKLGRARGQEEVPEGLHQAIV